MAISPENLSRALSVLGPPEKAVAPETVWGQTEIFYPERWTKRWPKDLPLPEFLERQEKALSVSRQRLFEFGESIDTPEDAVSFYVAVCSWGTGTDAQQTYRCVQPLHQPGAPGRLLEGLKVAATGSGEEGYFIFDHSGSAKVKGLGPAFFTKLLYFAAGRPAPADTRHPLILDRRVAAALGWTKTSGWRTSEYSQYLDLVEQLQERWRPDLPTDVIEYTLFQAGRGPNVPSI
ncbi:8-oxoguanine DNA glycosylase OGG fold protein [Corynebacterium sanguinis]|uniref:8-oxoguanine DNA glycosylase OGG fold protein n=1 Tax=Corynebacterium sanguinis TaxID=2594913 RepID=UPI0011A1DB96|nr:hypothetical protein [Corynebacterium sanguinis]MCT1806254.1 hypothetical protein [Corynebacterium sanguinis]MCT2155251.1 hypothetical protein [Corynebacterium sanguinis]MCT2159635.1 hypothetical protein [Corynebacterium sanguinis]TVS21247.1 hypothetical protein EKI50_10785 [Corynebacterium sanguinis]TVS23755.1 hypothetical protein EKI51_07185 [Corynebacterium sanguinis]